jgi:flagellar motor switch/type III secretory pathway protein FliN
MDEAKTSDRAAPVATAQPFQAPALDSAAAVVTASGNDARPNIDVILDVPVTLSLEVGRAQMSVGRLLRLTQGSVVELAADPHDGADAAAGAAADDDGLHAHRDRAGILRQALGAGRRRRTR